MNKKEKIQKHAEEWQKKHTLHHRMEEWRNHCMHSTLKKMTCGAQRIARSLSWAHGDNWRRKNEKK